MQNIIVYSDTSPYKRTLIQDADEHLDKYLSLVQKSNSLEDVVGIGFTVLNSLYSHRLTFFPR